MSGAIRIVQISDIHLFGEKDGALLGVNTHESLDAAIERLAADQLPDLIILSGDLSQDGSKESYIQLSDKLKRFPVPIYYVGGNHDNPKVYNDIYPRENITHHRHIVLKDWHIILLNSQIVGSVEGRLDHSQLSFMQHCLQMYPEHHAIVVFHHHPVQVGCAWLDPLGLTNADELWSSLASFPKMRMILFGHIHQQYEGEKNGIQYYSAPSTCIQFKTKSDKFALEKLAPGYRWIELHADGTFKTEVCRAPEYIGYFDNNAKGY